MFWIVAAVLTVVAIGVVVFPLLRRAQEMPSAEAYDLAIYKSQLKEIDGDVERGLIAESEAEAARAEVARRVLNSQAVLEQEKSQKSAKATKSSSKRKPAGASAASSSARIAGVVALMLIPFVAAGMYFVLGSPTLQSQPLAARLQKPPEQQSLTELVASAERRLTENPDDLEGWKKLAPIYLSMRQPQEAVRAFHNVLRLEGETDENLSDLGEALVVRDSGVVSEQAFAMFQRANQLKPEAPKPRFFIAIALGQQGKEVEAIDAWKALIDDSDPDAPWVAFAKNQIASLNKRNETASTPANSPPNTTDESKDAGTQSANPMAGPTREDMEAAAEMTAEDRQAMIENMVSQLAERLDEEGGTADQWVQLIRAELVLNRPDMAAKTVTKALEAMQSDLDGLQKVKAAARSLGLSVEQP